MSLPGEDARPLGGRLVRQQLGRRTVFRQRSLRVAARDEITCEALVEAPGNGRLAFRVDQFERVPRERNGPLGLVAQVRGLSGAPHERDQRLALWTFLCWDALPQLGGALEVAVRLGEGPPAPPSAARLDRGRECPRQLVCGVPVRGALGRGAVSADGQRRVALERARERGVELAPLTGYELVVERLAQQSVAEGVALARWSGTSTLCSIASRTASFNSSCGQPGRTASRRWPTVVPACGGPEQPLVPSTGLPTAA